MHRVIQIRRRFDIGQCGGDAQTLEIIVVSTTIQYFVFHTTFRACPQCQPQIVCVPQYQPVANQTKRSLRSSRLTLSQADAQK